MAGERGDDWGDAEVPREVTEGVGEEHEERKQRLSMELQRMLQRLPDR